MNKEDVQKALTELKTHTKRKFTQSYDLIINLKNYPKGNPIKVAAFVDQQLVDEAKKHCDLVLSESDFPKYSDKKELKKLADTYDYFISQANLMPKVAATFGKVLGIKGKMPNPKLGCVVPPNANLEPLVKKLGSTVRLQAKKATNLQCIVGKEDQSDTEIIDNILTVYQAVLKNVPNEHQNIKNVLLKLSMGKPVKL